MDVLEFLASKNSHDEIMELRKTNLKHDGGKSMSKLWALNFHLCKNWLPLMVETELPNFGN